MLPTEAGAKERDLGGGYAIEDHSGHPSEGDKGKYKLKVTNPDGKTFPHYAELQYCAERQRRRLCRGNRRVPDYTALSTSYTFQDKDSEPEVEIQTTEDDVVEGTERFRFTCGQGKSQYLKILDDDEATITVDNASATEGLSITFTLKHTGKRTAFGFKATPSYTNGTAESGDYTPNTTEQSFSGTLNEEKTFTVLTPNDDVLEGNETFTVTVSLSGHRERVHREIRHGHGHDQQQRRRHRLHQRRQQV